LPHESPDAETVPEPQPEVVLTDVAASTLSALEVAELEPFGTERAVAPGDILYRAGQEEYDLFVILDGDVDIVREDLDGEVLITQHGPGRFLGELNMLTGQRTYLTARVRRGGRVLAITPPEFRRLMASKPEIADTIFRAFVARRELLRSGLAADVIRIIGSRFSRDALALRSYAARARLVHTWIDLEDADDVDVLLANIGVRAQDTPVVVTPTAVLRRPTPGEFAEHLGLTFHPVPGYMFDLVVIGTGPAGLAAAVYGASEGLDTVSLDAATMGGQAGSSSRIENYVGFPDGISGEELAQRAAIQAMRLGARLNSPCEVTGMRIEHGYHVITLGDTSEIPCRAVIVATGARYTRLAVDDLERFEGAGVYYAATELEARTCASSDVIVVGGGNSAGQAAIFLAQTGATVSIAIRRDDLERSMSHYLVERIEADPRITVLTTTEVREVRGGQHLASVVLENTPSGERREVSCEGLFCFIGADPATSWLPDGVIRDVDGFVLTDRSLPDDVRASTAFAGREPLPFETSVPGVFAVGDVRLGSMKRVAAAVGEGSSAVRSVHDYLATISN
jgi:thioredoxin reductase (NADPH)